MLAESGGNPTCVSSTNDYGVFQIHNGLQSFGSQIFDPEQNIRIAYQHYFVTRGWSPWSSYTNGSYKLYL
jgi:hypothetical protein